MRKATLVFASFIGLGLFGGCAEPAEGPPDEASTEPTDERSQALCCVDFTCPLDGEVFTGCTAGPPIAGAAHACRTHCNNQFCQSSGLICD